MPTLVRQWLPNRVATGTIGYSAGMLMGAMLPAVLTIGYVLPAVGGSWRLDVLVWAVPAVLMVPVFYFLLETGRKRLCFRYLSLQRAPESACVKHRCPVKQ
jgi:cyanate permease